VDNRKFHVAVPNAFGALRDLGNTPLRCAPTRTETGGNCIPRRLQFADDQTRGESV